MNEISSDETPIPRKEELLYEMLAKDPDNDKLYYYMACVHTKQKNKAIVWHQFCFFKNPDNIDNLLDYMKIRIDANETDEITKFNDTNCGILDRHAQKDNRMKLLMATHNIKRKHNPEAIQMFLEIVADANCDQKTLSICYSNLGFAYVAVGEHDKAIAAYEKSDTTNRIVLDNLLMAYDYRYGSEKSIAKYQTYAAGATYGFPPLGREASICAEGARPPSLAGNLRSRGVAGVPTKSAAIYAEGVRAAAPLLLGYVSGDFDIHVIAHFLLPILRHHDRTKFEIHLFANCSIHNEWYGNERCHDIQKMTAEEVAELVGDLGIDILIDLSGHTEHNRLDVFALRPAPIQMTYLGFPNTTGLTDIQFRITDGVADHIGTTQYYSEQLLRLPCCFLCFDALYKRMPVKQRDARQIVFGSLNKESKISDECLDTWRDILLLIPHAVILLKLSYKNSNKERYLSRLGNRVIFAEYADTEHDYNCLFSQIDVLLDTFPYSGTTTTCKALYNSVPVITLFHPNIHAHNVSASILIHSGLSQYVAYSRDEYIQIARGIASDERRDETVSDKFREAIMNPTRFIQHYEKALISVSMHQTR